MASNRPKERIFAPENGCSRKASTILLALPAVFLPLFSSPFKYNSVYLSRIGDKTEMPEDIW